MVLNFHGSKIFAILENYKVYIRTLFMLSSHIGCNTCGWHTFHCSQRVSNPSNRCDIAKISGPSTKWSKIQTFEIFKIHIFTLGMELLRLYARCRSSTLSTGLRGYHVVYIRPTMAFGFHKSFPDRDLLSEAHPQIFCKKCSLRGNMNDEVTLWSQSNFVILFFSCWSNFMVYSENLNENRRKF